MLLQDGILISDAPLKPASSKYAFRKVQSKGSVGIAWWSQRSMDSGQLNAANIADSCTATALQDNRHRSQIIGGRGNLEQKEAFADNKA